MARPAASFLGRAVQADVVLSCRPAGQQAGRSHWPSRTSLQPYPVVLPRAALPCSFMERAVALAVPAAMLTNQYRMHPAICRAISAEFYADRLHTAAAAAARRALAEPCRMVQVGGKEVWHQGGGYSNPVEASK